MLVSGRFQPVTSLLRYVRLVGYRRSPGRGATLPVRFRPLKPDAVGVSTGGQNLALRSHWIVTSDPFCVRELCLPRVLSYLGNDLRRVVRTRPLVSVAVSGDRYSVGYSVARERVRSFACKLPARCRLPSLTWAFDFWLSVPIGSNRVRCGHP